MNPEEDIRPQIRDLVARLSSPDPQVRRDAVLGAADLLRESARAIGRRIAIGSMASRLPSDLVGIAMHQSERDAIIDGLTKLLRSKDAEIVGMSAFALEHAERVDVISSLADITPTYLGSSYVGLQIVAALRRLGSYAADVIDRGIPAQNAHGLILAAAEALDLIARQGTDNGQNTREAAAFAYRELRERAGLSENTR
ncbi:MAG: hypothetical protein JO352_00690 [Chloroflexi bacterium]|nr:hypothetical protein [Chloroflexota bacterium]